jgi:hypothetical protein
LALASAPSSGKILPAPKRLEDQRDVMPRRQTVAIVMSVVVVACTARPSPPPAPIFEAVGQLAAATVAGAVHTYILEDGRTFELNRASVDILFEGGPGNPVVVGTVGDRRFAGVFMHQDGLPSGCWLPGLGADGIEWGGAIEIHGVLWSKGQGFKVDGIVPALGDHYSSSTRFCFDAQAHVTGVIE